MSSISIPCPARGCRYEGPIWLYVGRVAVEKNIEAFLALDLPGTKVVVGDGPAAAALEQQISRGPLPGRRCRAQPLVEAYAGSDVFVFPSRTDTFGLVLLEALACGLPVAAYPVQGPADVVGPDRGAAQVAALDAGSGHRPAARRWRWPRQPGSVTPRGFALERFLAGLHPAIPAKYRGRAGSRLRP